MAVVQNAQAQARQEYQTAVNMTMSAYNIPDPSGRLNNGPNVGYSIVADPRIIDWTAEPTAKVGDDYGEFKGGNDGNFRMYVRPPAFFSDADIPPGSGPSPDPGYLASVLYHESRHASEAINDMDKPDLRNEPGTEVRIRLKQLLREDIFQTPSHQFLADLEGLVEENDLQKKWAEAMTLGKSPYLPEDRESTFKPIGISAQRTQEIIAQVHHDAHELMTVTDETDPASLENLRVQAETDFFRDRNALPDDQLAHLVSAWKKSLQVDAEYLETQKRLFALRMEKEIERCGFTPGNSPDGAFHGEFVFNSNNWSIPFSVRGRMSEEQYKVGVMIAATCLAMTHGQRLAPPCNDGLTIASTYAGDTGFASGIRFNSSDMDQSQCIDDIVGGLRPQMGEQDYYDLARRALRDYRQNVGNVQRQDRQYAQGQQNSDNAGSSGAPGGFWRPHPVPVNHSGPQPPAPGQCWFEDEKAVCN